MTAWLKIENSGCAPIESFVLLGASTKKGNTNSRNIGKFGSGNKFALALLLRNNLAPVVFTGNLKMEFGTRAQKMNTGLNSHDFSRVVVKYGGTDTEGINRSSTDDLGFVAEYGSSDWLTVDLALREFVSNSLDRAEEEADYKFMQDWAKKNSENYTGTWTPEQKAQANAALVEFRKTNKPWKNVKIEIVNDNQVRAKSGMTRVFIPMNDAVLEFYNNLGKWFLHFSEPELLTQTILPKKNRNLKDKQVAVIYRRGVRVREVENSHTPSLFDYNLEHLELDEARKVDDYVVAYWAGKALRDATTSQLSKLAQSFLDLKPAWEHNFSSNSMDPDYNEAKEILAARSTRWQNAFEGVAGSDSVICTESGSKMVARKGYNVVKAPESFVSVAERYGVRTPDKVLTNDDKAGRTIVETTPDAIAAVDFIWDIIASHNLTNNRPKPNVASFVKIMDGESQILGFYRDNTVYLNKDIADNSGTTNEDLSQQLLVTALEECVHHLTQSTDNSRDFQDYALNLAVIVMRHQAAKENKLNAFVEQQLEKI